ncbi:MAG TPA: hypothetical protein VFW66_04390 [Gemmatimonadales bacterium]|nr:hypothetical protein [Gemmatimonadales bacterium]
MMITCEQMSDRMPEVSLGHGAWSDEETGHLAACGACRDEWALVTTAGRLGIAAPAGIDVHQLTERVLGRLRAEALQDRRRRQGWGLAGLAAAAALALAIWTGQPTRRVPASATSVEVGALGIPLPELDSLGTDDLQAVLQAMNQPATASDDPATAPLTGDDDAGLGDLDTTGLRSLLNGLEG